MRRMQSECRVPESVVTSEDGSGAGAITGGTTRKASPAAEVTKRRMYGRSLETRDELAELESELRRAYCMKALQAQMAGREAERMAEELERRRIAEEIKIAEAVTLEEEEGRRMEDQEKCERYRRELEDQMKWRKEEKRKLEEEAKKERKVLEEVDRIVEEEERKKILQRKKELADRIQRERVVFEEMREIRKRIDLEEEERRVLKDLEYNVEIEKRSLELQRMRSEFSQKKQKFIERIAKAILDVERKKVERENLLTEIVAEEMKREWAIREEEERLRRIRMVEELATGLQEQIVFTEQCKMTFVREDKLFAEEIMKRVMDDERTAKLTSEAMRRARLEYRRDLNRLVEERRKIREREILRIEDAVKQEEEMERSRLDRIKDDRKRLLAEHATNIAQFLRKSALSEEERSIIRETVQPMDKTNEETGENSLR
ncbi:meiosis-specific nuclear structural protein 1-like [Prorops nasuta]|uniref:meiosis-specific nuclear structural protein 1-like n=1 Tax=Prorops nasuta TaxID=863751 RepID=UPI0034D01720